MPFGNALFSRDDGAIGDSTTIILQSPTFTPCPRFKKDAIYILLAFYGLYMPLVTETYQGRREETQSTDNLPPNGRQLFLDASNDLVKAVGGGIHLGNGSCFQGVQFVRKSHGSK